QGRASNRRGIPNRLAAFGGIDDQIDLAVFNHVDDMRAPLIDLIDALALDAFARQYTLGSTRRAQRETQFDEIARNLSYEGLVLLAYAEECLAAVRQPLAGSGLRLGIGLGKGIAQPHHFTG